MPSPAPSRVPKDRFVLAPGEAFVASAEVIADTPTMAKAWRVLYVTDRRLVLCASAYWPFFLLESALAAALCLSLGADADGDHAVVQKFCIGGLVLVAALRGRFKRRRLIAQTPIRDVETFARAGKSIVVGLSGGATWWLAPAKILAVVWSPFANTAIQSAAQEIQRAIGLPVAMRRKQTVWWRRPSKKPLKPR